MLPTAGRRPTLVRTALIAVAATVGVGVLAGSPRPAGAATTCVQDWRPAASATYLADDGAPSVPPRPLPPAPAPTYRPFHLFCGGRYIASVWVAPTENPFTVYALGRDVVAVARYPSARPAVNPDLGVTGLASWFWATVDDAPLRMLRGNGMDIDIELRPASVRWRFGDDTTTSVLGWGAPYPAESPVRHVFERKGTYTVEARVGLIGRVRGEELDVELPGGHTVTLRHEVAEIRSLLRAG